LSIRERTHRALRYKAEILTSIAAIAGWFFLTSAIADLWRAGVVWRISLGLFFLSLTGWRLLQRIVSHGLYKLTRG
jgi:hypothetical protein